MCRNSATRARGGSGIGATRGTRGRTSRTTPASQKGKGQTRTTRRRRRAKGRRGRGKAPKSSRVLDVEEGQPPILIVPCLALLKFQKQNISHGAHHYFVERERVESAMIARKPSAQHRLLANEQQHYAHTQRGKKGAQRGKGEQRRCTDWRVRAVATTCSQRSTTTY